MSTFLRFSYSNLLAAGLAVILAVLFMANPSQSRLVAQEIAQPSKAHFINTLTTIVGHLEKEEYAQTAKLFYLEPDFEQRRFAVLLSGNVISSSGVESLAKGGQFGKAVNLMRKSTVEDATSDFGVTVGECYAMTMEQDEKKCMVLAHWTGTGFKVIDINGVGEMDPAKTVARVEVPVQSWPTADAPTKELFIETLKVFLHQVANKHFEATRPNVYVPENFNMIRFSESLERKELSADGIAILAEKGTFGKSSDVFPKLRAESFSKRFDIPVAQCYGLTARIGDERGEAVAHWVDGRFKLLRTDDIGKLPEAVQALRSKDSRTEKAEAKPMVAAVEPPAEKATTAATTAAMLPAYETDKNVVMANYPALLKLVGENPNDVSLRAKLVHSLLVIGNSPGAWKEASEIFQLAPTNIEVVHAIDQSIEGLRKNGIFQAGVPQETFKSLMGKPLKETTDGDVVQWQYPNWNIEFNQGRFVSVARAETKVGGDTGETNTEPMEPAKPLAESEKLFNLKLVSFEKRVSAIHVLRTNSDMKLGDAVKLVNSYPVVVFENLNRERAEELQAQFADKNVVTEIIEANVSVDQPENTTFSVEMSSIGPDKFFVIKAIREIRKGMLLRDAMDLVSEMPAVVLEGVNQADADAAVAALRKAGATVERKSPRSK